MTSLKKGLTHIDHPKEEGERFGLTVRSSGVLVHSWCFPDKAEACLSDTFWWLRSQT